MYLQLAVFRMTYMANILNVFACRTFKVFDDKGDRKLSLAEFQKGLSDYNTGVTQEVSVA